MKKNKKAKLSSPKKSSKPPLDAKYIIYEGGSDKNAKGYWKRHLPFITIRSTYGIRTINLSSIDNITHDTSIKIQVIPSTKTLHFSVRK